MAGFEVAIHGRFWVAAEDGATLEKRELKAEASPAHAEHAMVAVVASSVSLVEAQDAIFGPKNFKWFPQSRRGSLCIIFHNKSEKAIPDLTVEASGFKEWVEINEVFAEPPPERSRRALLRGPEHCYGSNEPEYVVELLQREKHRAIFCNVALGEPKTSLKRTGI
jgi:hypothetical protein